MSDKQSATIPTIRVQQLVKPGFADELMQSGCDKGRVNVIFADNVMIEIPTRVFILNLLFWEPNISFGVLPISKDVTNIKSITTDSIKDIQTKLYKRCIKSRPDVPYMQIIMAYLYNVDRLSNFIQHWLGYYMPSIDVLGLARLMQNPALKKLTEGFITTQIPVTFLHLHDNVTVICDKEAYYGE
jgi:hypothetical protein